MRTTVAIIGMGHVGRSMYDLLSPCADIVTYDVRQDDVYPGSNLSHCSIGVICVDTPPLSDGACDISNVVEAVKRIPVQDILLKSTVPPGTTDGLIESTGKSVCFSPEYVGESEYYDSFRQGGAARVPFLILGGIASTRARFVDFFQPILGPEKVYFQCSALEAELVKYLENSFFATKVSFVNEFRNICDAFHADWHTIRQGWLLDPRVNPSHTAAFKNSPGFGGKCLPKDLRAIIRASEQAGYMPTLLREVLASNRRFREGKV